LNAGFVLIAALLLWAGPARADDAAEVLTLFKEYMARSDRFDPSLADLYADDAVVRSKRVLPGGRTEMISFSGAQWKALIRQAMSLAKERGDRNTFRNIAVRPSGTDVIVTAERYSHLKSYASPLAQFWRKDQNGTWRVGAELTETRP